MIRSLLCLLAFTPAVISVSAQRHEQVWLDYQLDCPFANNYLFEVTATYQTVLTTENKWRNIGITPTFEYQGFRRFDLIGSLPVAYTAQRDTVNSFELDPSLGVRFHITQNKKIDTRLVFKVEERIFHTEGNPDWDHSNRLRLKAEAWISINGPNLFTDKLWYAVVDYEEFYVTDDQLDERFANRRRARIGLGYRLNYRNRFELFYARQSSRNEIQGGYISGDNVVLLRYKMYLNQGKPVSKSVP